MLENKRKICVWVPEDLYQEVVKAGYEGPTSAVTEGFKLLTSLSKKGINKILNWPLNFDESYRKIEELNELSSLISKQTEDIISNSTLLAENKKLKNEVERLTEALQKAPDPVELAELQTNLAGLQKLLEEKDKRIEDLTKAVDMLSVFANYFKTLNQNK